MPSKVKIPPRLWKAIGEVEISGLSLANIAFNLAQYRGRVYKFEDHECDVMDKCRREWDEAQRKLSRLIR